MLPFTPCPGVEDVSLENNRLFHQTKAEAILFGTRDVLLDNTTQIDIAGTFLTVSSWIRPISCYLTSTLHYCLLQSYPININPYLDSNPHTSLPCLLL